MGIDDIREINRALRATQFPSDHGAEPHRHASLAPFWDAFTRHLFQEIVDHGRCALLARQAGDDAQLHVETGTGRTVGAFRDPLGLAPRMLDLGIVQITFAAGDDNGCTAASIEAVIRALLAGGYQPLDGTDLHVLADHIVDQVTDQGLPVLPGVAYVVDEALLAARTGPIEVADFGDRLRSSRTAAEVIALLRDRVEPYHDEEDRSPYLRLAMGRARRFNEIEDDVAAAVELWCEVARLNPPTERLGVIAIMMNVAKKRGDASKPKAERDVAGAVRIYEGVLGLDYSPEQNQRVLLTLMDVANRLTDLRGSWSGIDVEAAVLLWTAAYRHDPDAESREHTVRAMMEIGKWLTDLDRPDGRTDVAGAATVWGGVARMCGPGEDRERAVLTMMAHANRLTGLEGHRDQMDPDGAVLLWRAVYELSADEPDQQLRVIKTMMDVANALTDLDADRDARHVEVAAKIWEAIIDIAEDPGDRERALRTMMGIASGLVTRSDHSDDVADALRLWGAAYRGAEAADSRLRVTKTVLDIGSRERAFASVARDLLEQEVREDPGHLGLDPTLARRLLAGLTYYLDDFEAVLQHVDPVGAADPFLLALRADARRKHGNYLGALFDAASVLKLRLPGGAERLAAIDARVSALCCRGYVFVELCRRDEESAEAAIEAFEKAIALAQEHGLPVPPRALNGIGFAHGLKGNGDESRAAFAEALRLDKDNRKALEQLRADA